MSSGADHLPETSSVAGTQVCPACGTPYLTKKSKGCAVCLMRGALESELDAQVDLPTKGPESSGQVRFHHYEILRREDGAFEELGRGAMGVTYRALDTVLSHTVALKVLDSRLAAYPPARERFLREPRAPARLRHANVASVFYYGVRPSDGQCFYAMELVEGETVDARVRRTGPLPVPVSLEIITQVDHALAAAESQGVVHRDLKPANLMLVSDGPEMVAKVIDFGLAKAADVAGASDLTDGGFVGTPAFTSPEQSVGGPVDTRSDLYTLGITLWVMLTGQAPFRGSPEDVRQQHHRAPLPLEQLRAVPQPVVALLKKFLEKDPCQRFQHPTELLQVLPRVSAAIDAGRTLSDRRLRPALHGTTPQKAQALPRGPNRVSIARLPVTGSDLFGREEDIALLDSAWANKRVNLVTIAAWAGVGKSTLVNHWLRRMAANHYRSAELVFGWSFYRQGSSGGTSSADEFLDAALSWFGDPDPRLGTAWEKGERLAKLVARHRTLLVLDGLEPLQNPPGPQEGRIREPSLQALLRELAAFNKGLCVITTRTPIADIADYERTSALRRDLDQLSSDAGAKLLRALGVNGDETELRTASDEFTGHCLALTLLGSYLADAYNGDIRRREEVSARLAHDLRQGAHARKVMESYQTWLGEGPEVAVLRMLGLFDRPADEKAIAALLKTPAIPGLTEPLTDLTPTEWRALLARLRRAKLLAGEDPHNPGYLDTHPLVREYFGEQLRSQQKDAWKECNRRLYNYYRALAPRLPDSVREMEPLFLAVICGCNAGLFREALQEVYIPRIQRGNVSIAANILGVRGALLSVLIHFFENLRWDSPVETGLEEQSLTAEDKFFILSQAALYLGLARGESSPEARVCNERLMLLCDSLDNPVHVYSALRGMWGYLLNAGELTSAMQLAKRACSVAQEQNAPTLLGSGYHALACTVFYLGDFETAHQYATLGVQIFRSNGAVSLVEEKDSPAVSCLFHKGLSEWHLGDVTSSHLSMAEAISLAKELKDIPALTNALFNSGNLSYYERDSSKAERFASEATELSTRHNFVFFLAIGSILRGWAWSALDRGEVGLQSIEDGIRDYLATGSMMGMPFFLGMKAEAFYFANRTHEALEAIEDALLAERSGLRCWSAELNRLRGVFLTA